jgi:hypothetical protein
VGAYAATWAKHPDEVGDLSAQLACRPHVADGAERGRGAHWDRVGGGPGESKPVGFGTHRVIEAFEVAGRESGPR